MIRLCPSCGKESEWELLRRSEVFEVRGENIKIENELYRCGICGTEFLDMNSEFDPFDLAYREYRRRKGMIQPEQIKDFRKKYGLSQKELSSLLGLGEVTLSRYENGSLQDEVHDKLLSLAMEPINLKKLLVKKRFLFQKDKFDSICDILNQQIVSEGFYYQFFDENESTILTGNHALDFEKINQIIRFLTYKREIVKTKLLKLLFYIDFKYFKESTNSITGLKYARLPFGPVPDDFELLLGFIYKNDSSLLVEIRQTGEYPGDYISTQLPFDQKLFSRGELDTLQLVDTFFASMNAKQIEDYSHEEEAYKRTSNGKLISYDFAKSLSI
jgi:putative zinc finger/helix-turn-helix YgiT family protein